MRSILPHYASNGRREPRWSSATVHPSYIHGFLLLLCLTLGCTGGLRAAQGLTPPLLELVYTVRVERPTTHLVGIDIAAQQVETANLQFVMPAWGPGRYAIYDFAKNVQEFSAEGAGDHPLPWIKLDKQTWRVDAGQAGGTVHVHYKVFANDLTGSFSQVDSVHANLNGPSVFMYVDEHKPDPITLKIEAPAEWKVISGFSTSSSERTFRARNYDLLVDTPLEISGDCSVRPFSRTGEDH